MLSELIEYCQRMGEEYIVLSPDEKKRMQVSIRDKYIRREVKVTGFSISDALDYNKLIGTTETESYKWIIDFIKNQPIVVFFNPFEKTDYIKLMHGNIMINFYEVAFVDEFYITDDNTNFLLSFNHSQCLGAMGKAIDWLINDVRYIRSAAN